MKMGERKSKILKIVVFYVQVFIFGEFWLIPTNLEKFPVDFYS